MTALETTKYQMKGTAFQNLKKYLETEGGVGYFDHMARKVGFGQKIILSSSWYEAEKYYEIQKMAAEDLGYTLRRLVMDMSSHTIEIDLNGVYKFFIKVGGARRVLARFDKILKVYANYGDMTTLLNEDGHFQFLLEFPSRFFENGVYGLEGGIKGILFVCNRRMTHFDAFDRYDYRKEGEDMTKMTFDVLYN